MKLNTIIDGKLYQRGKFIHLEYGDVMSTLDEYGVDIVVCLAGEPDPDMCELYMYVYNPVSDGKHVPDDYLLLADILAVLIEAGHSVLTHCNAGRNRSGLLNALIVRRLYDIRGAEALAIVRKGRPRSCGSNPHFEEYLAQLPAPISDYMGGK